jgi:O-antigen ligase
MENIDAHPVIGSGLMSDRIVLDGVYTHNLFLEIINAFGLPLGVFLIIALGFLLIRGFLGTRSIAYKNYICIFFAASVIRLLFSYSFMEDIHFYMMLGVCFSAFEKHGIHSRERDT